MVKETGRSCFDTAEWSARPSLRASRPSWAACEASAHDKAAPDHRRCLPGNVRQEEQCLWGRDLESSGALTRSAGISVATGRAYRSCPSPGCRRLCRRFPCRYRGLPQLPVRIARNVRNTFRIPFNDAGCVAVAADPKSVFGRDLHQVGCLVEQTSISRFSIRVRIVDDCRLTAGPLLQHAHAL